MSIGKIVEAVAAAMGQVKRVAKDNRNIEQKYDFASIDDFMAMVGPICAQNGLVTVIDEDGREFLEKPGKFGPTQLVSICYQITTRHCSGEALPTVRRHVEVIRSGPQAYGSAQSYILKQYYRGLLCIPTGDSDDPDFGEQRDEAPRQERRGPSDAEMAHERAVTDACAGLASVSDMPALQSLFVGLHGSVKSDPRVIAEKDKRKAELTPAASAPRRADVDDEIPY